jgi:hypothetical protein
LKRILKFGIPYLLEVLEGQYFIDQKCERRKHSVARSRLREEKKGKKKNQMKPEKNKTFRRDRNKTSRGGMCSDEGLKMPTYRRNQSQKIPTIPSKARVLTRRTENRNK